MYSFLLILKKQSSKLVAFFLMRFQEFFDTFKERHYAQVKNQPQISIEIIWVVVISGYNNKDDNINKGRQSRP